MTNPEITRIINVGSTPRTITDRTEVRTPGGQTDSGPAVDVLVDETTYTTTRPNPLTRFAKVLVRSDMERKFTLLPEGREINSHGGATVTRPGQGERVRVTERVVEGKKVRDIEIRNNRR